MDNPALLPREIVSWIESNVRRPIAGFEHKCQGNGNYYDYDQQILATKHQLKLIALSYIQRGKSPCEVIDRLSWFK